MTWFRFADRAAVAAVLAASLAAGPPLAHGQDASKETVRPEVGRPLQAAQKLIKDHKFTEALAKVREAEAVKDKTAYETFVTNQVRGFAAKGAGDVETAEKSFGAVVDSGRLAPADQVRFIQELAVEYYGGKDYKTAERWALRYFKEGGRDPEVETLLVQSYYLDGDYADAAKQLQAQVAAEQRANQTPPENQLLMLVDSSLKQHDDAGYAAGLEQLVAYYPKKDYWTDLINRTARKPAFADRLELDLDRLRLATGTIETPADYLDMVQLALADGLPGEAKKIVEQGYAVGVLGSGADLDRQKRLRDVVAKAASDDQKTLEESVAEAGGQKDGTGLVNTGLDFIGYGQVDKGLSLVEEGIRKGGLKRPEDAKLHLGIAYLAAGQKAKAIQAFETVAGTDGTADLAHLWLIYAKEPS